ncbi:PTS sugar transporter subunit IIB [Paratissierella segnis]|uniref:PTS sugar transporter subunit IIB n=1 Tax=Paratissierella segnis TaxID=2763679 RepID=A0A926IL37_9FIRM|nr:PTS sugar transporter subunit IIB [Paratissierella segnis]MBC8588960.1 PTS sugar transporter subunit IIB [Paratissierella segnis]
MRILVICGCGCGSSVILKMNAKKVIDSLGINADLEVSDTTTYKGAVKDADLILVGSEIAEVITEINVPIIILNSFVNKQEIRDKLEVFFKEKNML